MSKIYEKLTKAVNYIKSKTDFVPFAGIVLGSGLGGYASEMKVEYEIPYTYIEGFPVSTVQGHDGRFVFGYVGSVPVVAMKGRVHFYEGYDVNDVVMPIRLMGLLGAQVLILTNAAGGIDLSYKPGDLMAITDHITAFTRSPLIGENPEELGVRFPDMSKVYDPELLSLIRNAAKKNNIDIKEGVYLQATGPQYETPAEIRMFRTLGASAVGMSTGIEAVAARHMGMRVCGISCISNMAAGILDQPLNHKEVQETADKVAASFKALINDLIAMIGEIK